MSYKLHGPWIMTYGDTHRYGVVIYVANLIDQHGNVFPDGAYKVEHDGKRLKTFKGETAWADADRLAYDTVTKLRYA